MTWRHFSWCYLHGFLQSSIALIVEKLFITFISSMSLRLASPSFLPCMAPSTATQTHMHLKALKMDFKLFTLSPPNKFVSVIIVTETLLFVLRWSCRHGAPGCSQASTVSLAHLTYRGWQVCFLPLSQSWSLVVPLRLRPSTRVPIVRT